MSKQGKSLNSMVIGPGSGADTKLLGLELGMVI